MRVLHVLATDRRRGAEIFASSLVAALPREIDQQVAILRAGAVPAVSFEAPVEWLARGTPVPVARLDLRTAGTLRTTIRRHEPDVVVAHGGEALKVVAAADPAWRRRLVYRRIGDASQFMSGGLRERAYGSVARRAVRVVAVAEALAVELERRYGLDPERVVVISNGVDPSTIEPTRGRDDTRAALGFAAGATVVLSLGALTWEKDPLAHLDVVDRAAGRVPGLVHVLAGDGPLAAEVRAAASVARVPTLVLGSRSDVGDLLEASDALLLASRSEGMPACVIEAGMRGVPVAAYALSGVPEVVRHGETGALAPPGDRAGLALALAELLTTADRDRIGEDARRWCRERFDMAVIADRYAQLFDEVAHDGSQMESR
jgi:glycosyltransferase involved in cell wall biosynthesis